MSNRMFSKPFQWLTALPLLVVTGALAIIALGALAGAQSPDSTWRERLFDYFQRLDPSSGSAAADFHLVLIDRESVEAVGPWPWPRTVLADLVNAANEAGARGVILTEAVDSPDPLSPETIGEFWLSGARDEAFAQQLALLPQTDQRLASAFADASGAVGVSATPPLDPNRSSSLARSDSKHADWLRLDQDGSEFIALPSARYLYQIHPELADAARPAVAALPVDKDGVFRRIPLLWSLDEKPTPAIALEAARMALDEDQVIAETRTSSTHAQGALLDKVVLGEVELDTSDLGSMRLYPPKSTAIPSTSAARLLTGVASNDQLSGAVVLIGLDTDFGESVKTARGVLSKPAAHALAAAQIKSGDTPKRPVWTGYIEALAVMVFGAAAIMLAQRLEFWQAAGFAAGVALILLLGAFAAFSMSDTLINPLPPAAALFLGAFSVAGGRSIGGVLRDDNLRGSFHDTLPEPAMKRLREDPTSDVLKGVHRDITVLACELRIADEDLRTMETLPDEATKLLAAASIDLRQTIIASGGAADQADGGRLFAYFNAPLETADHVQAGCAAALRLIESMDKINEDLEASSRTRGMQIHLAIGIATGACFTGPMGHGRNNRYSAVGPAVDRAAFLRSQSEYYGPAMICDESVHKQTHHHFAYLELDKLKLRGEDRPVSVHALVGNPFIKSSKAFRALDDAHRQLLTSYRAGDMTKAKELLATAKEAPGATIALFDIYEERITEFLDKGLPDGWDGAHPAGG